MNAGGTRRFFRSCAYGSYGAMKGAKSANSTMIARRTPAMTNPLCDSRRRQRNAPGDGANARSTSSIDTAGATIGFAMGLLRNPDARIEPRVDQVGCEREPDVEHRHEQQHGLHDGKVLPADRLPGKLADPLHREYRLDD